MKNIKNHPLDIKIVNTLNYVFAASVLLYAFFIYWAVNESGLALEVFILKLRPAIFWFLFFTLMSTYYSWYQQEKIKLEQNSNLKDLYKQHKYQQQYISFILVVIFLSLMFLRFR